jgi:rare lipoprotein A
VGLASFFSTSFGVCAHRSLPKGTVVTVTSLATGRTARCTVADRGPYVAGRIIDLDPQTFRMIAPVSAGVVGVRIAW